MGCAALAVTADTLSRDNSNLLQPVARPGGNSNEVLFEIAFHKVIVPGADGTNRLLGAFVAGVPVPDLLRRAPPRNGRAEAATNAVPEPPFLPAMWVGDEFYADPDDIPPALAGVVSRELELRLARDPMLENGFRLSFAGHHFWVFTRLQNPDSAFPPAYQVCLCSIDQAVADARELRWQILAAGSVVLLLALALTGFITHSFSAPIRDLVTGTGQVRQGNFDVRVAVRSKDELGQLAASFNEMAAGLAQKERYRTVLNMVADAKIAQRLVEGEITLGGEEREVTVLFCDIRGFTAHTENMPPGEVINMLNEHMSALTRVVKEHNGVLDKFVGDLLMAIFGAPLLDREDTLNAARCALRLIAERERLNQTSRHALRIGIGLATGRVVAGCMGSAERLNYTVLGGRVNLGSRLCDEAGPGEVLMDEATRLRLGEAGQSTPRGELSLTGFSTPVTVWRLVSVK
jgi:class 3 adenylate cyclase